MKTIAHISLLIISLLFCGATTQARDTSASMPTLSIAKAGQTADSAPKVNRFTIRIDPSGMVPGEAITRRLAIRFTYRVLPPELYGESASAIDGAYVAYSHDEYYYFTYTPGGPVTYQTYSVPDLPASILRRYGSNLLQISSLDMDIIRLYRTIRDPNGNPIRRDYNYYLNEGNRAVSLSNLNQLGDIEVDWNDYDAGTRIINMLPIVSIREDNHATGEPYFMITMDTSHIPPELEVANDRVFNIEVSVTHHYTFQTYDGADINQGVTQTIPISVTGRGVQTVSARWPSLVDRQQRADLMTNVMYVTRDRIVLNGDGLSYLADARRSVIFDGPTIDDDKNKNDDADEDFTYSQVKSNSSDTIKDQQQLYWSLTLAGLYDPVQVKSQGEYAGGYGGGRGLRRTFIKSYPINKSQFDKQLMNIDGRELYSDMKNVRNLNYYVIKHSLFLQPPNWQGYQHQLIRFIGKPVPYRVSVGRGKNEFHIITPSYWTKNIDIGIAFGHFIKGFTVNTAKSEILGKADMLER